MDISDQTFLWEANGPLENSPFSPPLKIGLFSAENYHDGLFSDYGIYRPDQLTGAVTKRKAEYLAGRLLAKQLLEDLGFPSYRLLPNHHRSPVWPQGVVGSISHTDSMAICTVDSAVNSLGVGVDIEKILDERTFTQVKDQIFDQQELGVIEDSGITPVLAATLGFSIKESIFKAFYPTVGKYFDFSAAKIRHIDLVDQQTEIQLASWLSQFLVGGTLRSCFTVHERNVVTQVTLGRQ